MIQDKIQKERLAEATALVSRHVGHSIACATIHGSILRGFNDPNSDTDICFLLERPVPEYINMANSPFFEGTLDDRRKRILELSQKMSIELGWQIMVSLLDMRSLLRGILSASTFSLMAYERFAESSERVKFLFEPIAFDHFNVSNLIFRCGERISSGMHLYRQIAPERQEYRQERTYLGTLWSAHRLLAYLGGDRQHCRTIQELIENNRVLWEEEMPEGFNAQVTGVIRARTERSPFELPRGVPDTATRFLEDFTRKVLMAATQHLRANPKRLPSAMIETRELIDMCQVLLDEQDDKAKTQDKELVLA
jgi:predicted nucleotidyltransferase